MTKAKKGLALFFAIVMIVSNMFSMTVPVSAATTNYGYEKEYTIYVTTTNEEKSSWWDSDPYIILTQSKGVYEWVARFPECFSLNGEARKTEKYGMWDIEFESTDGEDTSGWYPENFDGFDKKIMLKPGKTYKITVKWDGNRASNFLECGKWTTIPTWKVDIEKNYKIRECR